VVAKGRGSTRGPSAPTGCHGSCRGGPTRPGCTRPWHEGGVAQWTRCSGDQGRQGSSALDSREGGEAYGGGGLARSGW
jgi:hypothetical protein